MKTTKTTNDASMLAWLNAKDCRGNRRIEVLGFKRLAAIYSNSGKAVREAIRREARRCGFTPTTILALKAE